VQALLQYDFPGNVRELQNLIERGVIMAGPDEPIDVVHLFRGGEMKAPHGLSPGLDGRLTEQAALAGRHAPGAQGGEVDADAYRDALVAARYNVSAAARALGLSRAQMSYRLRRLGLL
jgi:transcriptional regulator with GAF, ATPase, and Fis domain